VKLLRFLQDGSVTPLGSDKTIRVSVRLIAATHRDLKGLVAGGQFREDLYYRLAGYEIALPPLRERRSDIPLLVEHFRQRVAAEMHRDSIPGPSRAVLEVLDQHDFPGNVRELEQVIRRTVIDSGTLTDPEAVARALREIAPRAKPAGKGSPAATDVDEPADDLVPLDEAERRHIVAVLKATSGNQTQAAFILGIERKTLARKIKRLGIVMDEARGTS
jgi:transcriptional regulator with GAF, ATPase, and Fis domain